jgi:hypothetical protein
MPDKTEEDAFWEITNLGFAEPTVGCDLLHPDIAASEPDPALTETQYFGFNLPDERIHALAYLWYHPNLRVVMGGVWAWQGIKGGHLEAELFDFVTYASADCLANDLYDYELPNGYHVNTITPLEQHRIRYADESRGHRIDVQFDALMPAMITGNGHHLEQAMRTSGHFTLAGREYEIAGYNVRDRTWGELRKDTLQSPLAPIDWMTGVFGEDLCFGCTAMDTAVSPEDDTGALKIGWMHRDGELRRLVSAEKRTQRSARTLFPEVIEMRLDDETGRSYDIHGDVIAACPWNPWLTMETVICLVRWECEGRVGYGDLQSGLRPDYIRAHRVNS